ncbi:hypothetical protein N3C_2415 [Clostridium sp. N3C]|nr:hypothetical protein [Clostridiales bacterium]SCN25647.1 hypothetical protein N3C_2415 [Clostridium sp. N3C]
MKIYEKKIELLLAITTMLCVGGCNKNDKVITLTEDVKEETLDQENEVENYIHIPKIYHLHDISIKTFLPENKKAFYF